MVATMMPTFLLALGLAAAPAASDGCGTGHPAIAVHVIGLKNRLGTVRVRLFGGPPATYFDKKRGLGPPGGRGCAGRGRRSAGAQAARTSRSPSIRSSPDLPEASSCPV